MDYSFIHKNQGEVMGMQNKFTNDFQSHVYKLNETFEETDVTGNNNVFTSFKTETNDDIGCNPTLSLKDAIINNDKNCEVESPVINYSSFKTAMDLRIHNKVIQDKKKTIFDDADYFSRNYLYKLLPISFEQVDEAIIQTEHNYCHFFMSSESEVEEDCSRTIDYIQIKEKNYKRRKTKNNQINNSSGYEIGNVEKYHNPSSLSPNAETIEVNGMKNEDIHSTTFPCTEPCGTEPLDLSAPLVQEEKTDHCLREHQSSIINNHTNVNEKEDGGEFDSDKENLKSNLKCIEVTITRPGEKEDYQPCDLFLNDIARLVPRLIRKDCFEIEILDKTCDPYVGIQKHRLYYIISESTWRLFQSTSERVILTNDQTLGQPVQEMDCGERPTFLVFDQFSLAQCLADYCKEIGGCFEYTCVEETKEEIGDVVKESSEDYQEEEEKVQLNKLTEIETEKPEQLEESRPEDTDPKEVLVSDSLETTPAKSEYEKPLSGEEETEKDAVPKDSECKLEEVINCPIKTIDLKETNQEIYKAEETSRKEEKEKYVVADINSKDCGSKPKTLKKRRRSPSDREKGPKKKTVAAFHIRTRSKSTSEPENGHVTSQKSDKISLQNGKKKNLTQKKKFGENRKAPKKMLKGPIEMKTRSGRVLRDAIGAAVKSQKKAMEVLKKNSVQNSSKRITAEKVKEKKSKKR